MGWGVGGEVAGAVQGAATCGRKRGISGLAWEATPSDLLILKAGSKQQLVSSLV